MPNSVSTNCENLPNYDGENMLCGANILNNKIKSYLNTIEEEGFFHDSKKILKEYKLDIEEYLGEMHDYTFAPRDDRLTKEGIIEDLHMNLKRIKYQLLIMRGNRHGGKRKTEKRKTRKGKKTNKKDKKGKSRKMR